jgi:uncharacterized membrane protein YcaP (DUF421 family)
LRPSQQSAERHGCQGIATLAEIDLAVIETDGTFSFFTRQDGGSSPKGPAKTA